MLRSVAPLVCALALLALWPAESRAERGWIRDEVRINKRTGPGTQFRIVGVAKTGDGFDIVSREEKWTQIRDGDGESWIPAGYLQVEPPASVQLERYKAETSQARESHGRLTAELEELRTANAELTERFASLEERATELERDNIELRAGARWPEWIAGGSILLVGGVLGIAVHASTSRRQTRRIRL